MPAPAAAAARRRLLGPHTRTHTHTQTHHPHPFVPNQGCVNQVRGAAPMHKDRQLQGAAWRPRARSCSTRSTAGASAASPSSIIRCVLLLLLSLRTLTPEQNTPQQNRTHTQLCRRPTAPCQPTAACQPPAAASLLYSTHGRHCHRLCMQTELGVQCSNGATQRGAPARQQAKALDTPGGPHTAFRRPRLPASCAPLATRSVWPA